MLCPHVFLRNFFNINSNSKILVIFQQRTEWASRKNKVFLMRVLRKLRKSQKTKWEKNWWTPCTICLSLLYFYFLRAMQMQSVALKNSEGLVYLFISHVFFRSARDNFLCFLIIYYCLSLDMKVTIFRRMSGANFPIFRSK